MKQAGILAVVLSLGGCALSGGTPPVDQAALTEARARLGMGGCDAPLLEQVRRSGAPQLYQEAAYNCLQQGRLELSEQLLQDYSGHFAEHENADYSAYLWALAGVLRFQLVEGDDHQRLTDGREAHRRLVDFVRTYPASGYRQEVAPLLQDIHEGMARAEYQLAQLAAEQGEQVPALRRMRYVIDAYPRSGAAADARVWLTRHNGAE